VICSHALTAVNLHGAILQASWENDGEFLPEQRFVPVVAGSLIT
jgi:hypothetical protein